MKKDLKDFKGITLIALVITIIVLLILAGVAISMLSGENGILRKAADAKTKTEKASIEEAASLKMAEWIIAEKTGETTKSANEFIKEKLKQDGFSDEDINKIYISNKGKVYTGVRVLSMSDGITGETYGKFSISDEGVLTGRVDNLKIKEDTLLIPSTMNGKKIKKIVACDGSYENGDYSKTMLSGIQIQHNEKGEEIQADSTVRKVIIDEGIETIGENTFTASNIEEIVIPSSVKTIEGSAFVGCANLKSITIPSTVTHIEPIVYGFCQPDEIVFEGSNPPNFSRWGRNCCWSSNT